MFSVTACGASKTTEKTVERTEEPLTCLSNPIGDMCISSNVIETEEGVTIICTSNYVLMPTTDGQFMFQLSEWEYQQEKYLEENYDFRVIFGSNGHIYQIDFYDYKGSHIATEKCNGLATVNEDYDDTYVDKVVLHIEYEEKFYTAEFTRGGK